MNIVIDTNVVISGVFFGGLPRKILEAVIFHRLRASATREIVKEYSQTVDEMITQKKGTLRSGSFFSFMECLKYVEPVSTVQVCRDPDDDKFLSCAKDAKAIYIVSGDKDLLVLHEFEGIEIVTVREFCSLYPELFP